MIQSEVLNQVKGIIHGFGTFEEPLPKFVQKDWQHKRPSWKQVHQDHVAEVKTSLQECGDVDALFTFESEIPIAVVTADCVPVLLSHRNGNRVAAVHAGWRGTRARILRSLWQRLEHQGEKPEDWVAAVGPAIGPCCYEVSAELAEDFSHFFLPEFRESAILPRDRILDLPLINSLELKKLGISQVDLLRYCTRCSTDPKFHSHRRDHSGQRQWSVILKKSF